MTMTAKKKGSWLALVLALCLMAPLALAEGTDILFSFAGDCTLGGDESWMNYSIGTFKVMAQEQGDYAYFLEKAQPHFAKDDFTIVNLEGVLADSAKGLNPSTKWNFRGATEYVDILTLGSVEAVTLGNNHTADFGKTGLASTKETLQQAGIPFALDEETFILEKEGVKVGFIGFYGPTLRRYGSKLPGLISRLKSEEGCAAVVLMYHGGTQYRVKHNKQQKEDMRYAIDSGADLVIGHHPHALQGIEVYNNRNIVYSLGNFCYGGNRKPREVEYPSMVMQVRMRFDSAGQYLAQQLIIHPYEISATRPRNNYQPYPVTGDKALAAMETIQADTPFPLNPWVEGAGAVQNEVPAR